MTWNYRVIRSKPDANGEHYYAIHEAYYDEDGKPHSITQNPVSVFSETFDGLREELNLMLVALKEPILEENSFEPPSLINQD